MTKVLCVCSTSYPHPSRLPSSSSSSPAQSSRADLSSFLYSSHRDRQLVSAPFKEGTGSFLWILGPLAFISSLLLPQIFLSSFVEATIKDEILAETIFYVGLATFLRVAEQVQRPYHEFSTKRWSLITGLTGYLSSVFFTMGLKVFVPLLAVYATWPVIGLPALVSVAPFLIGCGVQFMFQSTLTRRGSSCWPLLPIIFEVYRLYQLSKGAHFVQNMMFSMRRSAVSPELLDQSGAFLALYGRGFRLGSSLEPPPLASVVCGL
ncbi:hypothetical protein Taro_030045 [Colocasia esculenta]|uniref:Uncharacterized protein n=1 Tax=Colocasia esculenta TaxID=4460 RepID=A0A843VWQ6_COLES|nr:hypothetical protein [Colocasia esculenta]